MTRAFKALFRPFRRLGWLDDLVRRAMELWRQWPFVWPRGVVTCAADWIKREQKSTSWFSQRTVSWYREIYPPETHVFPRWSSERGEKEVEFHTTRVWYTPACGLYYLDGAYVFSLEGAVMSKRRELFDEFSQNWNTHVVSDNSYFAPFATFSFRPERLRHLAATVAITAAENYYHWMFNVMPRIHLLESVWNTIDYLFTPPIQYAFQRECLQVVKMPFERLIPLNRQSNYVCERLFVPSAGSHDGSVPRWSVDYLRSLFLPPVPAKFSAGRKLYLSRGDAYKRSLVNDAEVRRVMVDHGFDVVVPHELTIREQASLYSEATHLVGPHGAAFTNMVFSTGARVAEIFSPGYVAVGCYQTLAATCGHQYDYFLADSAPGGAGGSTAAKVDLKRLEDWLSGWLGEAGERP